MPLQYLIPFFACRYAYSSAPVAIGLEYLSNEEFSLGRHVHKSLAAIPEGYPKLVDRLDLDLFSFECH
jgi:hypothetical protein